MRTLLCAALIAWFLSRYSTTLEDGVMIVHNIPEHDIPRRNVPVRCVIIDSFKANQLCCVWQFKKA